MTAIDKVKAARAKGRPTAKDYIKNIFTDFTPLHGDRRFGDDPAVVAGIALFEDTPVTVIGLEKGSDTKDRIHRNFGSAHPEGYRKALRQMKLAEKFHRPIITFVDTSGAFCGIEAESRGQGQAIAENLYEMMTLNTPIISIFIGEGGSGGALALAVADQIWMLENSIYSVISPEGCASILWKDTKAVDKAAEYLRLTAQDLKEFGVADLIIAESEDFGQVYTDIKSRLTKTLEGFEKISESQKKQDEMLKKRYEKFRRIGKP